MQTIEPMPSVLLQNQLHFATSGEVLVIFIDHFLTHTGKSHFFSFKGHPVSCLCRSVAKRIIIVMWYGDRYISCVLVERPKKPVGFAFCLLLVRPWAPGDFLVGIIKSYVHV
jgi:hypothetical protein